MNNSHLSYMRKILLIEDEPGLIATLTKRLEAEGYTVTVARDGPTGLEEAVSGWHDLVILDVMLPGMDGFDICRDIRRHKEHLPILMLTARSQTIDKVLGFKLGADDYQTKPFQMAELVVRIEALLRRAAPVEHAPDAPGYRFADIEVDFRRAEVRKDHELLDCSAKEFQLLRYFIHNKGQVLSRENILNTVWGYNTVPNTRTVDVHVARLRQKIEPNPGKPMHLLTVHNMGYRFDG